MQRTFVLHLQDFNKTLSQQKKKQFYLNQNRFICGAQQWGNKQYGGSFLTFFRNLRTASDEISAVKGGASSAPAEGSKLQFFKKVWNLTFRFDITVFIGLFMASYDFASYDYG